MYLQQQIEDEKLAAILNAALYAPNGGNNQYARFLVIQNPDTLERMNEFIRDEFAGRELDGSYQNKTTIRARKPGYHFMFHAPTLVSAVSPRDHGNSMADCANALTIIQLAAVSLGLGACWINQPHWTTSMPGMRAFLEPLGLREDEDIFGSVALGYPSGKFQNPTSRKEGRIALDSPRDL